jgi:beta-glucosidase
LPVRSGRLPASLLIGLLATVPIPSAIAETLPMSSNATAHPELWPEAHSTGLVDDKTEAFITDLMAKMSLREKVGQMIQGDMEAAVPEDLRDYPLGSVLAGGNSAPPNYADDNVPIDVWIRTTAAYHAVAIEQRPGHVPIPLIMGVDSVHGASNFTGATVFPHNIGLGAARDPQLIEQIAAVTATETAASGFDWAFGPAVSVPQDDRWGRTFEGYSERPEITAEYAAAYVRGLQGAPGTTRIQDGKVAASAKHFLADGATKDGIDQGDAPITEQQMIELHAPGYVAAVEAGAMTIMASFSSWNGAKMHGNKSLLTDVLKGRLGFDGFIIGDWNAHSQVPGCTGGDCPVVFNAGLDMAMAPHRWKELFDNTLKEAENGTIPLARVDDAVRRILRVKVKLGLFDPARPAIDAKRLATPEHRAIARRAVTESLVLLKNNGNLLPIRPKQRVLVTGTHADDIGLQSGGWTISWQGRGGHNADFKQGVSLWAGLKSAIEATGGTAVLSPDGNFADAKPDVAIVIFGEQPYAEHVGDINSIDFSAADKRGLEALKALKAKGIPTVGIFLSGRPLWVNPEINQSDAFVAGFLPGTEGEGVADVLVAKADGTPNQDFHGKLSFSWPKRANQAVLNVGEPGYDPLFAYDYGLKYQDRVTVPPLDETPSVAQGLNIATYYTPGKVADPWTLKSLGDVATQAVDSADRQEGALKFIFTGGATVRIVGPTVDLHDAGQSLRLDYRVDTPPKGQVTVKIGGQGAPVDITDLFKGSPVGAWASLQVPLACFQAAGADLSSVSTPFLLESHSDFIVSISGIALDPEGGDAKCPGVVATK